MWFDSLEAVRAFAGDDDEVAVVPANTAPLRAGRRSLTRPRRSSRPQERGRPRGRARLWSAWRILRAMPSPASVRHAILGAHAIIYSEDPDADRAFLRDVLGFPHVDAGDGWLIFGLPPAELAVHPSTKNDVHEIYLMTGDVEALVASMEERGIAMTPVVDRGWGLLTEVTLPGGGKLGIYEPRHASPPAHGGRRASSAAAAGKGGRGRRRQARVPRARQR
jgi:hypothetical protein